MWERVQQHPRYDEFMDVAQHYGKTIIFALGVVKATELVFKTKLL